MERKIKKIDICYFDPDYMKVSDVISYLQDLINIHGNDLLLNGYNEYGTISGYNIYKTEIESDESYNKRKEREIKRKKQKEKLKKELEFEKEKKEYERLKLKFENSTNNERVDHEST